jgi:hypothetical protein
MSQTKEIYKKFKLPNKINTKYAVSNKGNIKNLHTNEVIPFIYDSFSVRLRLNKDCMCMYKSKFGIQVHVYVDFETIKIALSMEKIMKNAGFEKEYHIIYDI